MALADNYRILEYVSDGRQVEFPVLWRFFDPDTVLVKIYSKDGILVNHLSYGRDYSVVATGEDTGRVTLTAPVASGLLVVIYRLEPYVQLLELLNSGKFDLVKLEETLDHIVMLCQQNRDEILRCLKVPPGSDMTGDEFIDDLLNKYNEIIFIFETIKKLLQNLVCQTIEPFTTKAGVRKYYIGEGLPLDSKLYNLLLVLGGVVQEPKQAYTIVDESHIQFTENPPAGLRGWGISAISTSTPDLRQMVQDALAKLAYATTTTHGIMMVGDGLSVTKGRVSVDFSAMPTDKFEALLKQIRVPIWLEKNKNFYVSAETGSDVLDDGRGESKEKPFRTLQACINYVSDNYNLSRYNVTIKCLSKLYALTSTLQLSDYTSSTGYITIEGLPCDGEDSFQTTLEISDKTLVNHSTAKVYRIKGINYKLNMSSSMTKYGAVILSNGGGSLYIDGFSVTVNMIGEFDSNCDLRTVHASSYSTINLQNTYDIKCTISVVSYPESSKYLIEGIFVSRSNGTIACLGASTEDLAKISCSGKASAFAYISDGSFGRNLGYTYPMTFEGDFSGKRYAALNGGTINTAGLGQEFFPGDSPGTIETSTFSWYK